MKRLLLLLLILLLPLMACGEEFIVTDDDDDTSPARPAATEAPSLEAIPWNVKISPNRPDPDAYLPGRSGYHDASIDVRVATMDWRGTLITCMYVTITDPCQFRTGMAANSPPYALGTLVSTMSARFHAVCAVSGDWFGSHTDGIVYRNGKKLRMRPVKSRDTLIVDENGDFHIITGTTAQKWAAYTETGTVLHTFCFGPALVVDGEINPDAGSSTLKDLGRNKRIQRTAAGQLGPLHYVFVTCDGPQNKAGSGLTVAEMAEVMYSLGCTQAYNLDGASSSTLVLQDVKINAKGSKKRPVGDCIWFATLVPNP